MSYGTYTANAHQTSNGTNMAAEVARTMRTIFKRCVQCPDTTPSCPTCKGSEICSLVPYDCNTCQHMTCIANPLAASKSAGPNVGAIAGGVIGGVVVVAVVVFFVWRFWIKKRREQQELEAEEWEDDDIAQQKATHQFNAMHTDAVSTRTRGSLANSILSRASNIIQIAYIPGVTNRNGSGHNSLLGAGPVPPIPAAQRSGPPKSPLSNEGDALFFRPGDLRDSSYSATSSLRSGNRDTQYTRQSITPSLARSSVHSEVYRDDATQVPMPAQTVLRAAPRMVSVKSSSSSGSPAESPDSKTPVSEQEYAQFAANTPAGKGKGVQVVMPGQGERPSTSSSLQSQASQYVKAKQVTVGSKGRFPVRRVSDASTSASTISKHAPNVSSPLAEVDDSDEDEEGHARARQSLVDISTNVSSSPPRIQPVESPFFDASEHPPTSAAAARANPYATMGKTIGTSLDDRPKRGGRGVGALSDIIEEATRRASRVPSHEGLGGKRDLSPFSDAHETD
ncbi:hypothetical protein LTR36_010463 [Oleoguttula mirabilis]|uniref:Membrane anchor Opy2 N-terminal domain-containing protein n=1 Tax=Oleoguttula mirabilis TaxID=1507867 RepID=A0AAV9J4I8_9PEZI|nr:hypothetical protein LTR36_010463 [Oleoguttula mirabilis]